MTTTALTPRRPLRNDQRNPLEDWLSGARTIRRKPDGRLRRAATLAKYAWCVALLGHDEATISAAVRERDEQPEYQKWAGKPGAEETYLQLAKNAIHSHELWAQRQRARA